MIHVENILSAHGIDYIDEGPNVSSGNVNIQCPWCGDEDPSYHLGIHTETGWFGCWRNPSHKGRDFRYLLCRLLGISRDSADQLVGKPPPDAMLSAVAKLVGPKEIEGPTFQRPVEWDDWAREVESVFHSQFYYYLQDRGFRYPVDVASFYDLRGCIGGRFKSRLLFPLKNIDGRLFGWVGRAVTKATVRYLTYPDGPAAKQTLLYLDQISRPERRDHTLLVGEGPMDATKLDWLGRPYGFRGTCLFGARATTAQIELLLRLAPLYKRTVLMLDSDAWSTALRLQGDLSSAGVDVVLLRCGDPGALTLQDFKDLMRIS